MNWWEHTLVNPNLPAIPPGGFYLPTYLQSVQKAFVKKFQTDVTPDVFCDIIFTEEHDYEKLDVALPALLLDFEDAKLNPLPTEFKHEGHSIYSNLGELELYANMRAVVLVNNRSQIPITDTLSIDPQAGARHLAFEVAGFVNAADRFGEPCGMSQVSHIEPIPITAQRTTALIAWHVRWQHSISIGDRDTSQDTIPPVNAADVKQVMAGFSPADENPILEKSESTDDPNTAIDERDTFDTKHGYIEIYKKPSDGT